jgi:hypothetical protein
MVLYRMPSTTWNDWLRRLRHDLVKRLLWPARDRRDVGGAPHTGELRAQLVDDEGRAATAAALWADLKAAAPNPEHPALAAFESVLTQAAAAAEHDDVDGVLALEPAFDRLTQVLAGQVVARKDR